MKNFNIATKISISVYLIIVLFPNIIINIFDWYVFFDNGNTAYNIFMFYIFLPVIVAAYTKNIARSYFAISNIFILYFVIEIFNNHLIYNNSDLIFSGNFLVLVFVITYVFVIVWGSSLFANMKNYDKYGISSFVNPININIGYKWTYLEDIINKLSFNASRKNLYIDNFKLDRDIPKKEKLEQTKIFINPLDTTKTIVALGKMGSGKTEFFNSILAQNNTFDLFNREVIHDVKGDFTQKFYDKETDFIFNPYDDRGCYWDIWHDMKESESLVMSFVVNLIEYYQKEKDFFSSSASKIITEYFIKTHYSNINNNSSKKWDIFLNEIKRYSADIGDDRTKSSIYANMELVVETFKLFAWQSKQEDIKIFTLKQFLISQGRLILLNNASYSKKLYPIFTGFVAMLIELMLSKDDTKDDLTLILLDEYLSIKFDDDIRLKLQTQIRSKGGCLFIGIQYIDMQNQKTKQLLDSSKFATLIFNVSDAETIKHICSAYGTVSYEKNKQSYQISGGKNGSASKTFNIEDKQESFLTPKHFQSMPKFHHITLIPEENIFYLGYTPLVEIQTINKAFDKRDLSNYYEFIYKENTTNKTTKKEYSLEEKRDIYNEFINLDENDENYDTNAYNLSKKYNLETTDLTEFFKDVIGS